jgi:hypothetical protein
MVSKIAAAAAVCFSMFLVSCSSLTSSQPVSAETSTSSDAGYMKVFYSREGAGEKSFYITPYGSNDPDLMIITLTSYSFRDTIVPIYLVRNSGNCTLFDAVRQILSGVSVSDTEPVVHDEMPTGTWQHVYAMGYDGMRHRVIDETTLETMREFERIIDDYMTENQPENQVP